MSDREELIALRRMAELEAKANGEAAPAAQAKPTRNWSDIPGEALSNIPESAGNLVKGIYQAVRHPIDTAGTMIDAAAGGLRNAVPEPVRNFVDGKNPNPASLRASETADAVGGFYKDRYGSMDGFKNALATDPVGMASDLSVALSGGAAIAPKASALAAALKTGAKYTNPLSAVAPVATAVSDKILNPAARRLMQSALKPNVKQLKTGDARVAIDTLLERGISPNRTGVEKLRLSVDDVNQRIAAMLDPSNATVNRGEVANYLGEVRNKFTNQVDPIPDLNEIQGVAERFANHPGLTGSNIPVQTAHKMKQGTYRVLKGKYGEVGSAATEAQKALARGLKDKIADVVPGIGALNAEESALLKTITVAEKRALAEANKDIAGLAQMAASPTKFALFMADRSAGFKAIAARMINQSAKVPKAIAPVSNKLANPALAAGVAGRDTDQR